MGGRNRYGVVLIVSICLAFATQAQPPSPAVIQEHIDRVVRNHPFLGSAVKPYEAVAGGYLRAYKGGIVYLDSANLDSAGEVHGEILTKYLTSGGPAGPLGFPRTSQMVGSEYANLSEEYLNHVTNVVMGTVDDGDYFSSAAWRWCRTDCAYEAILLCRSGRREPRRSSSIRFYPAWAGSACCDRPWPLDGGRGVQV